MFTFAKQYNQNQGLIGITKFNPLRAKADSFGFRRGYFLKSKKMYSLTKDQLRQLTDPKVKEWFPEVFEVNLEVGKWYKSNIGLFCITKIEGNIAYAYGFQNGIWEDSGRFYLKEAKNDVEATNEEVFEALKIEAVRRGFVNGARITPMFPDGKDYYPDKNIISRPLNFKLKGNIFEVDGGIYRYRIFVNGKWANVIEIKKMTKIEIEKQLGYKIEII